VLLSAFPCGTAEAILGRDSPVSATSTFCGLSRDGHRADSVLWEGLPKCGAFYILSFA
jgi:hypothetical protein